MKRIDLLFLLFVAGAGLAYWLKREGDSQAEGAGPVAGTEAVTEEETAAAELKAPPEQDQARAPASATAPAAGAADAAAVPEEARGAGRLRARVLTAARTPAEGLRVHLAALSDGTPVPMVMESATTAGDGLAVFEQTDLPLEGLPPELSLSLRVDVPVEPVVELALGAAELEAAEAGTIFELVLPPGAEELGGPLRVQVLDAGGAPALGVEVGFRVQGRGNSDRGDDVSRGMSQGPDGIALLDREDEARILSYFSATRQAHERVVTCRGPLLEPPSEVLPEGAFEQPVVLELGPTFALEVELVGPDGERITEGGAVQLSWTLPGEERRDGFRWLDVEDGRARVEHVSCGLGIALGASIRDSFFEGITHVLEGDPAPGERVAVSLRFEEQHPVLAGRLLDEDGEPIADARFTLELYSAQPPADASGPIRFGGSYHGTGADGAFELPWPRAESRPPGSGVRLLRFVERAPRSGAPEGWFARYAEVEAPPPRPGATRYEVGDVRLRNQALLVAGHVVDEAGQPKTGVPVYLRYTLDVGEGRDWYNHDRTSADEAGRFEFRSFHSFAAVRVQARENRGGGSDELEPPIGADDVRLVFVPPEPAGARGQVTGRILADGEIPWAGLELQLRREGGRGYRDSLVFNGRFMMSRVEPGDHVLAVVTDGNGYEGPAFVLEEVDLVVQGGEMTVVPAIDLRGRLRSFELLLLDPEGERIDRTSCTVRTDLAHHTGGWIYDGRLAFVAPNELDTFQLAVTGFEPVDVRYTGEAQELRLVRR